MTTEYFLKNQITDQFEENDQRDTNSHIVYLTNALLTTKYFQKTHSLKIDDPHFQYYHSHSHTTDH